MNKDTRSEEMPWSHPLWELRKSFLEMESMSTLVSRKVEFSPPGYGVNVNSTANSSGRLSLGLKSAQHRDGIKSRN